jgi:hypothetical protein
MEGLIAEIVARFIVNVDMAQWPVNGLDEHQPHFWSTIPEIVVGFVIICHIGEHCAELEPMSAILAATNRWTKSHIETLNPLQRFKYLTAEHIRVTDHGCMMAAQMLLIPYPRSLTRCIPVAVSDSEQKAISL